MLIAGHRGARQEAPENTCGGFRHLRDTSFRAVEFDVRQLKGGELVVIHDDNLKRTAGADVMLYSHPLEYLRTFNQAAMWPEWNQPEPLPLLAEVLDICRGFAHIEVEVKAVGNMADARQLAETLASQLAEQDFALQQAITVTSFDDKILDALQRLPAPLQPAMGLLVEQPFTLPALLAQAQSLGCKRIGIRDNLITEAVVQGIHQRSMAISAWTVNSPERATRLAGWGVDVLITDQPALIAAQLP